MKLYKKSERTLKTYEALKGMRLAGCKINEVGEYCKWKDLNDGGKLQVKFTVYRIKNEDANLTAYVLSDTLDRIACQMIADKQEVMDWLKEHGYKPVKQWYIEDYGMTEEDWNVWNGAEEQ